MLMIMMVSQLRFTHPSPKNEGGRGEGVSMFLGLSKSTKMAVFVTCHLTWCSRDSTKILEDKKFTFFMLKKDRKFDTEFM
jgi:hypothetical protein